MIIKAYVKSSPSREIIANAPMRCLMLYVGGCCSIHPFLFLRNRIEGKIGDLLAQIIMLSLEEIFGLRDVKIYICGLFQTER
jgi:hypothetical protein